MGEIDNSLIEADRRPKVGVGIFVLNEQNDFLMGRRKGSNGAGTYALPGGHLEFQESFEDCAARELEEETGITIPSKNVHYMTCTNNILHQDSGKHYVTIFMVARLPASEEPKNLEPEKCEGWEWFSWDTLLEWVAKQDESQQTESSASNVGPRLFPPMITLVKTRPGIQPIHTLPPSQ